MILRVSLFVLLASAGCLLWLGPTPAHSQNAVASPPQQRRELTPQEKRGKAFYLRGESASGQEITAMMGEVDVPAATLTCAGCHGNRGEGRTEGGVTAGNMSWSQLTKPYGHTDEGGRKHAAFTESSFIRTMTAGLDPAGNKLAVAMPTYRMPQDDMTNLIAYLKRIETDLDPGVTDTSIVLGTVLPDKAAISGLAQSIEDVLQAYFNEINSHGGIYNRRIELHIMHGDSKTTVANVKHLIDDDQVFAIVSGLTAGAEDGVASLTQEKEVPFVGPSTLLPQRALPLNRYIFYLLPGLKEQGRALVTFAAKKTGGAKSQVAIVAPDVDFTRSIASAIEEQAKTRWASVTPSYYNRERFSAAEFVSEFNRKGIDTVFFFGSGPEANAVLREAEAVGWAPAFYLLGSLVGRNVADSVSVRMKDKVFFAFPTVPADVSAAGAAEYSGLLQRNKLNSTHAAAQASAIAAARILVHALELCGKDLSRERLITTLEGLYEYDTGLMPKITFGPNRRIGALGAYVVTIDPERKLFPASAEWVAVE
ncbi:MAG TPA: ABC transporter substrate-binding protein [Pyrinomonadaceae bacterium]|nr:ABC transporter substrate-binding protein [Pyrinomonadaceae bacterium]